MMEMLRVLERGERAAPAIVLLHGFMGRGEDWDPVADRLARTRRVVTMDLPGHGGSLALGADQYSLEGAARAVADSMERVGVGRSTVVGYSLGGRVAAHLAIVDPGRVQALVLESAHPGLPEVADRASRLALDRERARRLVADPEGFLDAWFRMPLFGIRSEVRRRRLVTDRLQNDFHELARALDGMSTGRQHPLGERLRKTGVPSLLVAGALDGAYVELLGRLAEELGCRLHVEEGAAHDVHSARPGAFASLVHTFSERTKPSEHAPD